jgi:hypothetical protein
MSNLGQLFDQLSAFERPPVENWRPDKTVEFDLRISANGEWIHEGGIIPRKRLVKLFSTLLVLRDGQFYLVTPHVKYRIQVDEAPFMAVELRIEGCGQSQEIYFRTNMDEVVMANADHPLSVTFDPQTGQPQPLVEVRDGLCAKLTRSVYYELAQLSAKFQGDQTAPGVYSGGIFFEMV